MIVSAAVRIHDKKQDKDIVIPCMRHWQPFYILKELGYSLNDFTSTQDDQGFLDEHDNFYNRIDAHKHAWAHSQLVNEPNYNARPLFSEDLW